MRKVCKALDRFSAVQCSLADLCSCGSYCAGNGWMARLQLVIVPLRMRATSWPPIIAVAAGPSSIGASPSCALARFPRSLGWALRQGWAVAIGRGDLLALAGVDPPGRLEEADPFVLRRRCRTGKLDTPSRWGLRRPANGRGARAAWAGWAPFLRCRPCARRQVVHARRCPRSPGGAHARARTHGRPGSVESRLWPARGLERRRGDAAAFAMAKMNIRGRWHFQQLLQSAVLYTCKCVNVCFRLIP
ncbi:hypothetical protein DFH27DRAFT_645559, partial [Peziza echinospora]